MESRDWLNAKVADAGSYLAHINPSIIIHQKKVEELITPSLDN